ncbi:MAG: hypothetical protein E7Z90_02180 [Cyanobacteria bacterium SIG29]|nr:hypothetical protein [Cyanobacteria bacterium SIG29]
MGSSNSVSLICNVISSTVFSVPKGGETAGSIAYNGTSYGGETAGSVAYSSTGGSTSSSTSSSCGSFSAIA